MEESMSERQLSYAEMQAVMAYIKAMERGDTAPPESVGILDTEILEAMRRAKGFLTFTGAIDHEHVVTVVGLMFERSPEWAEDATGYMSSTAIH